MIEQKRDGGAMTAVSKQEDFDFAVAGSSVFAATLSLALAQTHGARVCLIGSPPAALQINRDLALSLGPVTRPETLELLGAAAGELRGLVSGPGDQVIEHRRVTFAALDGAAGVAAGHMRHMFNAFGIVTALLPEAGPLGGFAAEGVWALRPRAFFAGLPARLEAAGVTLVEDLRDLQIGRDRVRFAGGHTLAEAGRLIVTDAVHAERLGALPAPALIETRTAVLTDPLPGLAGRLFVDIGTGGHVVGRGDGRIEAVVPAEDTARLVDWLGAFLPPQSAARVIATSRFPVFASRDGAPIVTHLPHRRAALLATGFGPAAAFLAPALARHLVGGASSGEKAYFAARGTSGDRTGIAEFGALAEAAP